MKGRRQYVAALLLGCLVSPLLAAAEPPLRLVTVPWREPDVLQKMWVLRKLCYPMDDLAAMEFLLDKVKSTKGNAEFFDAMRRG